MSTQSAWVACVLFACVTLLLIVRLACETAREVATVRVEKTVLVEIEK